MKKVILLLIFLLTTPAFATYDTVLISDNPGPGDNSKMRIIFVPTNWSVGAKGSYADENDNTFLGEVWNFVNETDGNLWATNWFNTNKANFDIYYVTDTDSSPWDISDPDTIISGLTTAALQAKFSVSRTTTNVHVQLDNDTGCSESQTGGIIYVCKDSDSYDVLSHEFAHDPIGYLDDEYENGTDCTLGGSNCDGLSKRTSNTHDKATIEKWSSYIDYTDNAPYEGARECCKGVWRPSENSIMRDTTNGGDNVEADTCAAAPCGFDPVARHAMDLGLAKRLGTKCATGPTLGVSGITSEETKTGSFTVTVTVTPDAVCGGQGATAERVEFYLARASLTSKSIKIDTTSTYTVWIDTTKYEDGSYYLDIVGYDSYWNYTRETYQFTIANGSSLDADLYVMESLYSSDAGVARSTEPVHFGVPIEKGLVSDASTLQLTGSAAPSDYDVRVLGTWSDGSVRAVEVSFITGTDSDADTGEVIDSNLALQTGGSLNTITSDDYTVYSTQAAGMATDSTPGAGYIQVATGAMTVDIKKASHNGIDKVVIGGSTVVSSAGTGGVYMTDASNTYWSGNDAASTVTIEQNGYTHCVLKADGQLKTSGGTRLMWYTVRYHFYRGETAIRALVTLRYANSAENNHATYKSSEFRTILNLSGTKTYKFPVYDGGNTTYTNDFTDANVAYLAQNYSSYMMSTTGYYDGGSGNNVLEEFTTTNGPTYYDMQYGGIKSVYVGTETHSDLAVGDDDATERTMNYVQLYDDSNIGAIAGLKHAAGWFPCGFETYADGTINVQMHSDNCNFSDTGEHQFHVGTHQTREIWLQFHTSAPNAGDLALFSHRMDMPIFGRCSMEYYRKSGIVYGRTQLATREEETDWHDIHGYTLYGLEDSSDTINIWREVNWGAANGNFDNSYIVLTQFLRSPVNTGLRKWTQIWSICRLLSDISCRRSDGENAQTTYEEYRYGDGAYGSFHTQGSYSAGGGTKLPDSLTWFEWDLEHLKMGGLVPFYYLSGEEFFKEALEDFTEYMVWHGDSVDFSADQLRSSCEKTKCQAYLYWFERDSSLKSDLLESLETLLESRWSDAAAYGWNMNRGFYVGDSGTANPYNCLKYNMEGKYFSNTLGDVYDILNHEYGDIGYARLEDLADYMLGFAQFCAYEWWQLDTTNQAYYQLRDDNSTCDGSGSFYAVTDGGATDDESHSVDGVLCVPTLKRGAWDLLRIAEVNTKAYKPYDGYSSGHSWETNISEEVHYLQMIDKRMTYESPYHPLTFTKQDLGSDQWKLTWTVPANCAAIKIKWYPSKDIVDWLGYDPEAQSYEYATANYVPYFAAYNYDSEPTPAPESTSQNVTIDFSTYVSTYNSTRNLENGDGGYVDYAGDVQGNTLYFDVEYLEGEAAQSTETITGITLQ